MADIFDMLPAMARETNRLPAEQRRLLYPQMFHQITKQTLWDLRLIFEGLVDVEGKPSPELYLPYRLTSEQRERAHEAFCILWEIIQTKQLEPTPIGAAKGDRRFQQFLGAIKFPASQKRRRALRGFRAK